MTDDSTLRDVEGGETSCYAHLLCFECGIVLDGSPHAATCSSSTQVAPVNSPDHH